MKFFFSHYFQHISDVNNINWNTWRKKNKSLQKPSIREDFSGMREWQHLPLICSIDPKSQGLSHQNHFQEFSFLRNRIHSSWTIQELFNHTHPSILQEEQEEDHCLNTDILDNQVFGLKTQQFERTMFDFRAREREHREITGGVDLGRWGIQFVNEWIFWISIFQFIFGFFNISEYFNFWIFLNILNFNFWIFQKKLPEPLGIRLKVRVLQRVKMLQKNWDLRRTMAYGMKYSSVYRKKWMSWRKQNSKGFWANSKNSKISLGIVHLYGNMVRRILLSWCRERYAKHWKTY